MEITYSSGPEGQCPVQAEGKIGVYPFYFRSRGEHWSLYISKTKRDNFDPFTPESWKYSEEYKGNCYQHWVALGDSTPDYTAGWADVDECKEFIAKAAQLFIAEISSPNQPESQPESNDQKE